MTKTASAKRKRAEREALKAERSPKRTKSEDTKQHFEPKLFVDKSTGADRVREAKLYEYLGSEDTEIRVRAAEAVVSSLLDGDGAPESVLQKHLDWRLFRGLASGRAGARLGYSLVITEILTQLFGDAALSETRYPGLSFDKVLEILQERTKPTGNMTGQEERDFYFGQLFGIECIVRAGVVRRDLDRWNALLQPLLKLASKKVWLRSQCGWVIVQALPGLGPELAYETIKTLKAAKWTKTPEGVAIWLPALDMYPSLEDKGVNNPLDPKSLPDLPTILRESSNQDAAEEEEQQEHQQETQPNGTKRKKKQANWTHQLHFVWQMIIAHFLRQGEQGLKGFNAFWKRAVDDNLFSKTATDGQKLRGFLVMQAVLDSPAIKTDSIPVVSNCESLLPTIFSRNLMTCLMNQAAHEDRYLHRVACKALSFIEKITADHPDLAEVIIENLIGNNGVYSFDVRTGQKTVENILQQSKPEMGEDLISVLSAPVMKACTTEKNLDKVKLDLRVYVEYLFKLANAAPESALQELTSLAYANPVWIPENASAFLKELSRSRLQSVFANLSKQTEDSAYLCSAIEKISPEYIPMDKKLQTAVQDARKKLKVLMKEASLNSEKPEPGEETRAAGGLALLYAIAIFQLYNAEPDAFQLLSDLNEYQARSSTGEKGSAEFLVEIILSMASQESILLRQASQQVFRCFTKSLTAEALGLLLDVLPADENAQGQQALFNVESDEVDPNELEESGEEEGEGDDDIEEVDGDDLGSDFEIGSDVEFINLHGEGAAEEDEEENSGSSDEEAEEEEEEEGEETEESKTLGAIDDALGKLLNSHRLDKDKDAESSDSDADMSDSEMLAIDDKLADVFKQRVKSKPSRKEERKAAKESVINFKRRVLALLDIFVRNEPGSPLALSVLPPLLQLMRDTTVKSLSDRALDLIREYQKRLRKARAATRGQEKGDETKAAQIDADATLQMLGEVHEIAASSEANDVMRAAASASFLIASTLYILDEASRPAVDAVFEKLERPSGKKNKRGKNSRKRKKGADVDMVMDFKQWKSSFKANRGP